MKHKIPHDLSMDLAKRATEAAFDSYKQRFAEYKPTSKWVTDKKSNITFTAKGITLNGSIELEPNSIDLELDVPFLFRVFKNKAMAIIEEEIREWIDKAKAGELD